MAVMSVEALPLPSVPTEPIYFEPSVEQASALIMQQSCVSLDNTIRYLHPHRYSYKSDFYQDKFNQVAVAMMLTGNIPFIKGGIIGAAYLGYAYFMDEKEKYPVKDSELKPEPKSKEQQARKIASQVIIALTTLSAVESAGLGLSYLAYSSLVDEKEQRRMLQVEQQISMLQQIKAEKHCFE